MRATRSSLAIIVAAIALIAMPSVATATPLTFTTHESFSETFADEPSLCRLNRIQRTTSEVIDDPSRRVQETC